MDAGGRKRASLIVQCPCGFYGTMPKVSGHTENMNDRVKAVEDLLRLFRPDRTVYISITALCLIPLFWSAFLAVKQSRFDGAIAIGLFGPTGAIAITLGRLLKMWNDAIRLVLRTESNDTDKDR